MRFEKPTYQELEEKAQKLEREIERLKSGAGDYSVSTQETGRAERIIRALSRIGLGIVITDATGSVASMSPVAEVLTGQGERDAMGRSVEEVLALVDSETGEQHSELAAGIIENGAVIILKNTTILEAADGKRRPVWGGGALLKGDDGEKQGAVFVIREIT